MQLAAKMRGHAVYTSIARIFSLSMSKLVFGNKPNRISSWKKLFWALLGDACNRRGSNLKLEKVGILSFTGVAFSKTIKMGDKSGQVAQADQYYDNMEYDKIVDLLHAAKDGGDVELIWRLARAMYEQQKTLGSDAEKLTRLQQGLAVVERAMSLDSTHPNCHKWMAIYLNAITKLQGSRAQIEKGPVIKDHMLKACEFGPKDPTNWHLIGMWAFTVADISWTMRKLATVVYGEPPKATYQEALDYYLKAEEAEANFYSMNLLMIGKAYMKLKDNSNATTFLKRARDFGGKTTDDKQAQKEAVDLLKSLGVKE